MGRTVGAADFYRLIKRVVLAAEDDLAAAEPEFTPLRMASPEMLGTLVAGSLPIEDKGWRLLGVAYLRLPGGELFSLELHLQGQGDGGGPAADLLRIIAEAAAPGAKAPAVGPGVYRLPSVQITLPADYLLQCQAGPDFGIYNIQRLQELQEAARGHLFFYLGGFPQPQRPADPGGRPSWAIGLRQSGEILGGPIMWRVLEPDGVVGSVHLGTAVEIGDGEKADIRVVCATPSECASFQSIAESLAPVARTPDGAPRH